jgi:VCBS repeat-containing protein
LTTTLDHLKFGNGVTSNGATQNIGWTWDPTAANLDFLNTTDKLTVTYAVHVADSANQDLVFAITGSNDAPVITGTLESVMTTGAGSNLVKNGGFESGNFNNWSLTGKADHTSVNLSLFGSHGGFYNAALGPDGGDGHLTQNVTTVAGQHYTLDFWLSNSGGSPNDFSVSWNGTPLSPQLVNEGTQSYTEYKFDVVGTGGSTALQFNFRQDPSFWHLDDVSVTSNLADGAISFADPDDTAHSATVTAAGPGYLGTFSLGPVIDANGTVAWHFNASSTEVLQLLNPFSNHVTAQAYNVTIGDGHSGGTVTEKVGFTAASINNDIFAFAPGMGQETVFNFTPDIFNFPIDRIELDQFGISNFDQLKPHLQSVNGGHDTLIDLGHNDSLLVVGVNINSLHASDFILHV